MCQWTINFVSGEVRTITGDTLVDALSTVSPFHNKHVISIVRIK